MSAQTAAVSTTKPAYNPLGGGDGGKPCCLHGSVLDTTITNVSLSHIAGTLGASQDESTWVLTSYLVANGIVLPLSGWLSGVLGRKRYL